MVNYPAGNNRGLLSSLARINSRFSTIRKFRRVQQEVNKKIKHQPKHYNLDAIISVGYRVNSKKGTQFRIWATQRLKDYAINQQRFDCNAKKLHHAIALIQKAEK